MTPREKAEDICCRMAEDSDYKEMRLVKRYALIAVDEILNELSDAMYYYSNYEYWQEVRNEIEKL